MPRHFTFSQLTFLAGVAIGVGAVLILLVYIIHKNVRRHAQKEMWKTPSPRTDNSQAFVLATMQGVITGLREDQKKTQDSLRACERRAEESARQVELMAREIEEGLMIFDAQGFLSLVNPAAHALLGIDIWSRRRYQDLLGAGSELARCVDSCIANGAVTRAKVGMTHLSSGEALRLNVTVVPLTRPAAGGEEIYGAICLLKKA